MKILKLFLAFAILSLSITNYSLLKAADEDDQIIVEETPKKGLFKSLLFWKNDDDLYEQNFDEITDEDLDPRLSKERAKPTEIRIRDKYGLKVDILRLFEKNIKEYKDIKDNSKLNKDTTFVVPLDEIEREIYIEEYYDREAPIIMSHLDIKQSVDSYKEKYFANFNTIGRIKIIYKNISENEIKGYGAYIGANLIIMQKLFEPTIGKYVYDIIFLSGDSKNKNLYWFRNSNEAEPLNKTLEALNITNLNDYMNIITHNLLNPNRKVVKKISENYELEKEKSYEAEEEKSGQTVNRRLEGLALRASQALQERKIETQEEDEKSNENSSYLLNNLTEEELYELQKSLITFRVNAVVGYWEDAISGDVIEIRVIPAKKRQTDIIYGAYAILDEDLNNIVRYTEPEFSQEEVSQIENTVLSSISNSSINNITEVARQNETELPMSTEEAILLGEEPLSLKDLSTLNINKSLAWISQDLKMQFSSMGGSGLYLDEEKMVEDAKIFFHPAKGLIVVSLPNNQYKYYKPIVPDIYPALEETLYNNLNIKDTDVDQDKIARFSQELISTPGTTNYILYSGVTLGAIVAFFLIMM